MFLTKRSNGYYYAHYLDEDGKWKGVSTRAKCKADANRFFSSLKDNLATKGRTLSIGAFTERYLEYFRTHHAQRTREKAEYVIRFFRSIAGEKLMDRVTPLDIETYKAKRLELVSAVTVNIELRALKAFFGLAYKWDVIQKHPFKKVAMVRIPERKPTYLTADEFRALLNAIEKPWLKNLDILAVNTGLRRGELINLKWEHVDLQYRVLNVVNTATFQTKSRRDRQVPLNLTAVALLESTPKKSEYVLNGGHGRKLDDEHVSRSFREAAKKAGLSDDLYLHSLRHTFATWLVQSGVGIYEVQKLMGHSSVAVTQIYAHLAPSELHSAVEKIAVSLN